MSKKCFVLDLDDYVMFLLFLFMLLQLLFFFSQCSFVSRDLVILWWQVYDLLFLDHTIMSCSSWWWCYCFCVVFIWGLRYAWILYMYMLEFALLLLLLVGNGNAWLSIAMLNSCFLVVILLALVDLVLLSRHIYSVVICCVI